MHGEPLISKNLGQLTDTINIWMPLISQINSWQRTVLYESVCGGGRHFFIWFILHITYILHKRCMKSCSNLQLLVFIPKRNVVAFQHKKWKDKQQWTEDSGKTNNSNLIIKHLISGLIVRVSLSQCKLVYYDLVCRSQAY